LFGKYKWLEYTVELDALYCFVSYLFKKETKHKRGDSFLKEGILLTWLPLSMLTECVPNFAFSYGFTIDIFQENQGFNLAAVLT
jgi:hypothetical protein